MIAEVTLRLHPSAEASCTVAAVCAPEQSLGLADRLMRDGLEPVTLEWYDGRLLARFEGTSAGVARRARATGFEEADPSVWDGVAGVSPGEPGDTVFRIGALPGLWPWVAERVRAAAGSPPVLSGGLGTGVHMYGSGTPRPPRSTRSGRTSPAGAAARSSCVVGPTCRRGARRRHRWP
ncbi:hypothetical protein [Streptomyces griseus]|uniref:hypothetical protein n=1 Tax=Streptomyces griseus TaxID=1911 RepID=UPI00056AD2EE|nr:hypothetical protein [Streptomyces griseus]